MFMVPMCTSLLLLCPKHLTDDNQKTRDGDGRQEEGEDYSPIIDENARR